MKLPIFNRYFGPPHLTMQMLLHKMLGVVLERWMSSRGPEMETNGRLHEIGQSAMLRPLGPKTNLCGWGVLLRCLLLGVARRGPIQPMPILRPPHLPMQIHLKPHLLVVVLLRRQRRKSMHHRRREQHRGRCGIAKCQRTSKLKSVNCPKKVPWSNEHCCVHTIPLFSDPGGR